MLAKRRGGSVQGGLRTYSTSVCVLVRGRTDPSLIFLTVNLKERSPNEACGLHPKSAKGGDGQAAVCRCDVLRTGGRRARIMAVAAARSESIHGSSGHSLERSKLNARSGTRAGLKDGIQR